MFKLFFLHIQALVPQLTLFLGTHLRPFPSAPVHCLRRRWLSGSFPAVQAEPVDHTHHWRIRWRRVVANHLY
jgi:hypothetical protein